MFIMTEVIEACVKNTNSDERPNGGDRTGLNRRSLLRGLGVAGLGAPAAARTAAGGTAAAADDGDGDAPPVAWETTYGGDASATATAISRTEGGAYGVAGVGTDAELAKILSDGDVCWNVDVEGFDPTRTRFSGTQFSGLALAPDGGYVLVSGDTVVKLDARREREWETTFETPTGLPESDYEPAAFVRTNDGGYAVAGAVSVFARGQTYRDTYGWVGKLRSDGTIEWNEVFEDPSGPDVTPDEDPVTTDAVLSLVSTDDGLVAGGTNSYLNEFGELLGEPWLVGFSEDGEERPLDVSLPGDEDFWYGEVPALTATADGGFALYGWNVEVVAGDFEHFFVVGGGDGAGSRRYRVEAPLGNVTSLVQTGGEEYALGGYEPRRPGIHAAVVSGYTFEDGETDGESVAPQWTKTLGDEERDDVILDLVADPDGGITGVGTAGEEAWVVKLRE